MAICQNIVLILITSLVIYLSYLFTPPVNYTPIQYIPKCIHLNDVSHFLCAFSYKIDNQNKDINLPKQQKFISINNQQGIRAFGIKSSLSISTAQLLHLVDYQSMKNPQKNQDIIFENLQPINSIIKDLSMQFLISKAIIPNLKNQQNKNLNSFPTELIIKQSGFNYFVVYQISKSPIMKSKAYFMNDDFVNSKFCLIASLTGFFILIVIFIYQACIKKQMKWTIILNLSVLVMVFMIAKQKRSLIGIHDYDLPAALFFGVCLLKAKTKSFLSFILIGALLTECIFQLTSLTISTYTFCLTVFLINGCGNPICQNTFHFLWFSMLVYISIYSERIFIFNENHDILRKIILAGILTLGTVLMQTMQETVMKQFEELTDGTNKIQNKIKGFSQISSDDIQEQK